MIQKIMKKDLCDSFLVKVSEQVPFADSGVRTHASLITGLKSVALNHSAISALDLSTLTT